MLLLLLLLLFTCCPLQPPKCLLKLLDEECRFPKGTDQSFIEKISHEMGEHEHFIPATDNRRLLLEFGIVHYAGDVVYQVTAQVVSLTPLLVDNIPFWLLG